MRKLFSLSPRRRHRLVIGCSLGVLPLLGAPTQSQATDIYTASYGGTNDTGGSTPLTSGTFSLGTFTITGIYGTGTTETLFITDGTANGRIFGTAPAGVAVGQQYTATVVASIFQGTEEFKTATNFTLQTGTVTVTPQSTTLAQVANTLTTSNTSNPFTASPADSLYASEGRLIFAPVTFTITPTTSGSLSTTTSTPLIDQATGNSITLFRSTSAIAYTAGQTYSVTGYEQPYNGFTGQGSAVESEIVGATSFTAVFAAANPLYRQTPAGSWAPAAGTDWAATAAGPGNTGWINDGTYTAFFQQAPIGTITINAGNINATGLEFDVSGYTIASDGAAGNTLTLQNTGLVTVTNASDTATISAPVAGSVGLNKNGAGTLILSGNNTYTGATTITAGTLQISAAQNLGLGGGMVTLSGGTLHTLGNMSLNRPFTGSGGSIQVDVGNTLTIGGVVTTGALALPGAGTVALTNSAQSLANNASNSFTSVTFQTGGASLTTADTAIPNGLGIINLSGGISATQATGAVTLAANANVAGTITLAVPTAGASLNLPGGLSGAAVIVKTGAGTLVLGGDNSALSGLASTATPPGPSVSLRQGTAGASPVNGGVISIVATTNPGSALGNGEYQANGGTISNDTGAALTLTVADISLGAQDATATPGGLVFAGSRGFTVNGPVSLFNSGTALYQHAITVNTPTTITGILSAAAATATKSLGLTLRGSSTLTLNAAGVGTMTEPVTIATSGTGSGVIALAEGTFAANTALTINAGASLTIQTGVTTGTTNVINDAALLTINGATGSFGKLVLTLGMNVKETVGGFFLQSADGSLLAGYQAAGTYGATGSGAQFTDNTLFSGLGVINNLGTAVPEPSAWMALGLGGGLLGLAASVRRRRS